jgi:transcriptional regulator with XRE-family HTH domain
VKYFRDDKGLKRFGQQLRKVRKEKGITQAELAFRCGFGQNQITNIERGTTSTSLSTVFLIARHLDIPLKDLFDFELPPLDMI